VAGGSGTDLMCSRLGGDRTKCCQKMKWMQRAHLASMERKRDTVRQRGDVDRRRGGTGEEKGWRRRQLS
jgi:hypothetical protein